MRNYESITKRGSAGASPRLRRQPPRRARRKSIKHGYSLLELSVSLPLMTMLFVALTAAIGVAGRALPDGKSPTSATLIASTAMEHFALDVRYATAVTSRSPTELVLAVGDRNGDAVAESIRYRWAGAGTAFTREINGSPPEQLVASVQQLVLDYETRLDGGTGLVHLRAVRASLTALPGGAIRYDGHFRAQNEPVLP